MYDGGTYNVNIARADAEILAIIIALENCKLFVISSKESTLRTDCQVIVIFYYKISEYKLSANK